jgi:hypothetical protein
VVVLLLVLLLLLLLPLAITRRGNHQRASHPGHGRS